MTVLNVLPQMLISMPSGGEWLWLVIGVIVLFGGKKIPELAKGIGKGIREFNDAKDGVKAEIESEMNRKATPPTTTTTTNTTNTPA
jgi:sec-independent protein translocase protein TatA